MSRLPNAPMMRMSEASRTQRAGCALHRLSLRAARRRKLRTAACPGGEAQRSGGDPPLGSRGGQRCPVPGGGATTHPRAAVSGCAEMLCGGSGGQFRYPKLMVRNERGQRRGVRVAR